VPGDRIEQRSRLRAEPPLSETTVLVRGGPDTRDKLGRHAPRTARAWSLNGQPLLGISVFAILDIPLDDLLAARFATYRVIHLPTAAALLGRGFRTVADRPAPALHHSPPPGRQRRARRAAGRARATGGQPSVR
jgi:hypothetical protein